MVTYFVPVVPPYLAQNSSKWLSHSEPASETPGAGRLHPARHSRITEQARKECSYTPPVALPTFGFGTTVAADVPLVPCQSTRRLYDLAPVKPIVGNPNAGGFCPDSRMHTAVFLVRVGRP